MAVLELRGCTPEPLGNYLKGLGVFRLIAEQADPLARAWWRDGFLHVLQSKWDASDSTNPESRLADWLLTECRFTPLIAPWQTGTGYLPIGKRSAGGDALTELLTAQHAGTEYFRAVFRDFAASLGVTTGDDPSKWLEEMRQSNATFSDAHLLRALRNRMHSTSGLKWLDAVGMSVSRSSDSDFPSWFPILASGGGEASGQYIVNHQQRLKAALLDDQSEGRRRLQSSLFAQNQPNSLEANSMGAMYYPSLMKAPNVGQDFLPNPQRRVNPWDFILLLEGTLVWSMAATRRQGVTSERASFPFYCRSSFGGSMMIGPKEVEGAEQSIANGELWCPTWNKPSTLAEIQRIFGEGRMQVGEKICSRSLSFALALKGLGVDRGVQAFHRFSLLKRSGSGRQTTLLAVPNGCFVPEQSPSLSRLVELREFAESVATNLTDSSQQSRRLTLARIDFERSWFDATTSIVSGNQQVPSRLLDLIVAVGRLMHELGANSTNPGVVKIKKGEKTYEKSVSPVGKLGRAWAEIIGKSDRSSVFCLARAVAGIAPWGESLAKDQPQAAVESIRANLLPVARRGKSWDWSETSGLGRSDPSLLFRSDHC
jgi:CRISPR-associated protein Csx17